MHAETVKLTEMSSLCHANYITIGLSFMCIGGKKRMYKIIYYYSPTCFDSFWGLHQGVEQE